MQELESAAEYKALIIAQKNNAPVYLRDVAEVTDTVADERLSMHFWARGIDVPTATAVSLANTGEADLLPQDFDNTTPFFNPGGALAHRTGVDSSAAQAGRQAARADRTRRAKRPKLR